MTAANVRATALGNPALPALVLVHGWGHHGGVWKTLLPELQTHFYVHVVDLPGYGCADLLKSEASQCDSSQTDWQLDTLLDAFMILPPAIWCGWSLGGMLATRFASYAPGRVKGLVTISSNPVFVEKIDWPTAMAGADYQQFADALHNDAKITLSRFLSLVCQGSETARADLRVLKTVIGEAALPSSATLQLSLHLLNTLDTRADISALDLPQCHLLGEHDALVPSAVASGIGNLNAAVEVRVLAGAGHAPFLSHPSVVIDALLAMAERL